MNDDARVGRWKNAWQCLYLERLPREEHESRRDEMFDWARARGDLDACMAGLSRSVPFGKPGDTRHPAAAIEDARAKAKQ